MVWTTRKICRNNKQIFNETAKNIDILQPLFKKQEKQGPRSNLRSIIHLLLLRKILAIIMIKQITGKVLQYIPKPQAAYQSGRSTTEHVFAIKLLAGMAILLTDLTIYLLVLDMIKAFDTVNRVKRSQYYAPS